MWRDAATVLEEVVAELRPDVILVLGYQMWDHLPELPVTWACVKHPCGGMSYDEAIPEFNRAIAEALSGWLKFFGLGTGWGHSYSPLLPITTGIK